MDQAAGAASGAGLLRTASQGSELPVVVLEPKAAEPRVAVWLSRDGKAGLFTAEGQPQPAIARLLDAGVTVIGNFPDDSHKPIIYPAALLTGARDEADTAFFEALSSDTADATFAAEGFAVLK